jgi:hypothetical protein
MPTASYYASMSDPDRNPAFRGWSRQPLPRNAEALDRLADAELALGHHVAAERLAWLAAGCREGTP